MFEGPSKDHNSESTKSQRVIGRLNIMKEC